MSRLSNSRVQLALQAEGAQASAWRGWPRARCVAEAAVALDSAAAADAQALQRLFDELARQSPIAGARLEVEVADVLVHFDVAQGDFAALGSHALDAVAQACAAELLGDAAADHVLRWQLQRDERHLLVSAMPKGWIDALGAAASAHGLRLAGIRPDFERQWNRHLAGTRLADAVFAVAQGPHALIACVRDGVIATFSSGPWCADSGEFADSIVDRLLAGLGLADDASRALLDVQVDRLLAATGMDPAKPCDFTLVSAAPPHVYLSRRWNVRHPTELAA